jgi:ribosomal protein S18 acetylase RimI-like enzyme
MEPTASEGGASERRPFSGEIRTLQESDLDHIKPILETWLIHRDTGQPATEEVEEDLDIMRGSLTGENSRKYFVAEEGGKVLGVIGITPPREAMMPFATTEHPIELVNAYVSRDERAGRGVGTALVKGAENEARAQGATELILNSGPRYEQTAWGFYDRLPGYSRIGVAENFYGEGVSPPVWSKKLGPPVSTS